MKKIVLGLLVMGLFVGGAFSSALAQETKKAFSLNLGVQTDYIGESPFEHLWFTLDARFGIAIGQSLEISPEVMAAVEDSLEFDDVFLYPGVMLNYKLGDFFVGAGVVLPLFFYGGDFEAHTPAPKVNFGYRARNLILTVYVFNWTEEDFSFLELLFIGATIGYRY
jgi:hypothetical protein